MSARIAVVILTYNEEENIQACIESVDFADEIILIDSGSEDGTCRLAESLGARVVSHPMADNGFAGQRNFALQQTEAEWVLYLDADERITPKLAKEISAHIHGAPQRAAAIKRESVVMGQVMRHGVYRPDYVVRLFPRTMVLWEGVVHERAVTELPVVRLKAAAHHECLTSWEQYFAKFDRYTTLMAEKMQQKGTYTNGVLMHFHAGFAFLQMYLLKLGFLDGWLGFILCQYHYFYTLTKYTKLLELQRKSRRDT